MNVNGRVYIDYDGLWYLMKSVVALQVHEGRDGRRGRADEEMMQLRQHCSRGKI